MTNASTIALIGLIAWALTLLVLMELLRGLLVFFKKFPANEFTPDNSNLSPFMQRLARAHANCLEGLPIFGGVLIVALVTEQTAVTDPLAIVLLAARLVQSLVHLFSLAIPAVLLRFTAFAVQLVIAGYWTFELLSGFVG